MGRRRKGKTEITCPQSGDDVLIESLLSGTRRTDTEAGQHALRSEIGAIFTEERRGRNEQMEKTCPSVFTLILSRGFRQLETWMESRTKAEQLELTLYCEHDSGWHASAPSVYRFTPDQEWFDKLKGSWNRLAGITKYVGPLSKAFGKVTMSPHMEAAGLGIEKFLEAPRSPAFALSRELGEREKPDLVDIETRALLEALINHLDQPGPPNQKKGALHRYEIEDGRLLWLCAEHLKEHKQR